MTYRFAVCLTAVLASELAMPAGAPAMPETVHSAQLGTPLRNGASRVVKITQSTRYVNAEHFEAVLIENEKGQRFAWRFDTTHAPTGFPLRKIAPPGFDCGIAWVYVDHPARHVATD